MANVGERLFDVERRDVNGEGLELPSSSSPSSRAPRAWSRYERLFESDLELARFGISNEVEGTAIEKGLSVNVDLRRRICVCCSSSSANDPQAWDCLLDGRRLSTESPNEQCAAAAKAVAVVDMVDPVTISTILLHVPVAALSRSLVVWMVPNSARETVPLEYNDSSCRCLRCCWTLRFFGVITTTTGTSREQSVDDGDCVSVQLLLVIMRLLVLLIIEVGGEDERIATSTLSEEATASTIDDFGIISPPLEHETPICCLFCGIGTLTLKRGF